MDNNNWVDDRLDKLDPESDWQPHAGWAMARFEERRGQKRLRKHWARVVSVAAVGAVCLLTFPQPRALAARVIVPCVDACESLVSNPVDLHDELHQLIWAVHSFLGLTPPNFTATDASGASFELSDYAGKVVLLNFWATWCEPCLKEIPWFAEFQREYGADGFAVVGVSLDDNGWKAVRPAMASLKIDYRVAVGDDALAKKYGGIESLPETLLIGRDGRVLAKHVGIATKAQYEREIVRSLWGQLSRVERDRLRAEGL